MKSGLTEGGATPGWKAFTGATWKGFTDTEWGGFAVYTGLPSRSTAPRRQIAVDQPQGGTNYPFALPPSYQLDLVVGDLHLDYRDDDNRWARPFSLRWLYGFGDAPPTRLGWKTFIAAAWRTAPAAEWSQLAATDIAIAGRDTPIQRELLIVDAQDLPVFDSRTASYRVQGWGRRCLVHEWLQSDSVLRLVEYWSQDPDDPPISLPSLFSPASAVLDDRALRQMPLQLRSLRVGLQSARGGEAILRAGYNLALTTTTGVVKDGGRNATRIQLAATPGDGDGRYDPGPPAYIGIKRINGTGANASGNFLLDASGCYRLERPVYATLQDSPREVRLRDHALEVHNDCSPCCECQDFLNVYEAIRKLRNFYADLIERARTVRNTHIDNVARFNAQAKCRIADSLRVMVMPQCPSFLDVALGYCNNTGHCLKHLYLTLDFTHTEDGATLTSTGEGLTAGQVVAGSTYRNGNVAGSVKIGNQWRTSTVLERYDLGGAWPYYWAHFDAVDPGSLASITTRFHFDNAKSSWNIMAIADAYVVSRPVVAGLGASPIPGVTLGEGPFNDEGRAARLVGKVVTAQSGLTTKGHHDCCYTGDQAETQWEDS